jgi:hypothetical protein
LQNKVKTLDADNRGLIAIRNSLKVRVQMLDGKLAMQQQYVDQLRGFVELHHPEAVVLLQQAQPRSPQI